MSVGVSISVGSGKLENFRIGMSVLLRGLFFVSLSVGMSVGVGEFVSRLKTS